MFRIAICDDNTVFSMNLQKQINHILDPLLAEYEIELYSTIQEFILATTNCGMVNLLFLDIEFPDSDLDGIYAATYLRTVLAEQSTHIVFISNQPKHAMQLFDFQPLQFLIKPINQEKLSDTIQLSLDFWNCETQTIHFISKRQEITIEVNQILYIESFGRKKLLHCSNNNVYEINDSFSNILEKLKPYDFFCPHKSFIVNYHKISTWHKEKIEMGNGTSIPIGRSKIKEVQDLQLLHHI